MTAQRSDADVAPAPFPATADAVDAPASRAADREFAVAIALVVVSGTLLHLWLLFGPVGVLDADSAVPGLMAIRMTRGEFPAFFWGQAYGGSVESVVAALLFLVVKPTDTWLTALSVCFSALAALLVWRIGLRTMKPRAAAIAGCLFWVPPGALLWFSTKFGVYWGALCLGLLSVLLLLRAAQNRRWPSWEAGVMGLVLGLAWWANPQTFYLGVPAALALARPLLRRWRAFPLVVVGAVIGALPWIIYNVTHAWASLTFPPQPVRHNSFVDHLGGFFGTGLPMGLGLRAPFSLAWRIPPVGQVLYGLALVGFVVYVWQKRRTRAVPIAIILAYPFFYSLSPFSWFVGTPRYLLFLFPMVCLVVADVADRRIVWAVALAAAVLFSNITLTQLASRGTTLAGPDVPIPVSVRGAISLLQDEGQRYAFSDYWIAYRVTFTSREAVIVSGIQAARYPPYEVAIRKQARPAYLFLRASATFRGFKEAAAHRAVALRIRERGPWAVVVPARKLLPEEVPEAWQTGRDPEPTRPAAPRSSDQSLASFAEVGP